MGCVISREPESPREGRRDAGPDYIVKQHHHFAPDGMYGGEGGNQLPALGVPAASPDDTRKVHDPNELARRKTAKKKRVAIAVEALMSSADVRPVPKSDKTTRLILTAVKDNPLFEGLNEETRIVLVSAMRRAEIPAGQDIITQGDENAVSS